MELIRILHVMKDFTDSGFNRIVERIIRTLGCSHYELTVARRNGPCNMEFILKNPGSLI